MCIRDRSTTSVQCEPVHFSWDYRRQDEIQQLASKIDYMCSGAQRHFNNAADYQEVQEVKNRTAALPSCITRPEDT